MGISGITDSEKKNFEGKREYFIREVSFLIEKFRKWREEERKRKLERDLASEAADDDDDDDNEKDGEGEEEAEEIPDTADPAARQLHLEAMTHRPKSRPSRPPRPDPHIPLAFSAPEPRPITSFFHKCPHLRISSIAGHLPSCISISNSASSVKRGQGQGEGSTNSTTNSPSRAGGNTMSRKSGRNSRYVYAFGCLVPDFEEKDFDGGLPGSWLDGEIRAQGRRWGRVTRRKGRDERKEREREEDARARAGPGTRGKREGSG